MQISGRLKYQIMFNAYDVFFIGLRENSQIRLTLPSLLLCYIPQNNFDLTITIFSGTGEGGSNAGSCLKVR